MLRFTLLTGLLLAGSAATIAPAAEEQVGSAAIAQAAANDSHRLHGVVNSINASAGRVNITHDPVESLKWPKMKMNFKVQDPTQLQGLKAGMEVDFEIQKMDDEYQVTKITPAK